MTGLVEEIQRDAIDQNASVASLLRKVKLAAAKLDLPSVETWVEQELNGYTEKVPDYRLLSGQPMSHDQYFGWRQIGGYVEQISKRATGMSIAAIEDMLSGGSSEDSYHVSYSDEISAKLNKSNQAQATYALRVPRHAFVAVLDTVRNLVLQWAIDLEKKGVTGSGISFRPEEKLAAQQTSSIHIGTVNTITGLIAGANNSMGDVRSVTTTNEAEVFTSLRQALEMIPDIHSRSAVSAAVDRMEATKGGSSFAEAYSVFVAGVADHIAVFGPYLTTLLSFMPR
jgi:hypothetical protein